MNACDECERVAQMNQASPLGGRYACKTHPALSAVRSPSCTTCGYVYPADGLAWHECVPFQPTSTEVHSSPMRLEEMTPEDWREVNADWGWTKNEYDASPQMANRLHARILDLEDENARLRRLIGEAYAKRGPDSSQVLRSLYGQATSGTTTARS